MELFDKAILTSIRDRLLRREESVAVAESVTSGLLQFAFSQIEDAACLFQGGITTYNLAQKTKHLSVEPIQANRVDSVSQEVSNQMALAACQLFLSNWGIGITGYATPQATDDKSVFAYYAIANAGNILVSKKVEVPLQQAAKVQLAFSNMVLFHFNDCLAD